MGKKAKLIFVAFVLIGIVFVLGHAGVLAAAEPGASSGECIKCHIDFNKMDSYGAAASSAGAATIAG
ncbi:MAG: hypothetical protein M0Z48_00350 [Nitrospiraceae bacterium]|nr:hypothetical protein [Nitrospiraceae bacterium]